MSKRQTRTSKGKGIKIRNPSPDGSEVEEIEM